MANKYPQEILDLNKKDLQPYIDYHLRLFSTTSYSTYEQAWDALERIFFNHFDKHRFDSYESFKSAKTKYMNGR